jgi:hypothetical protein
MGMGMGRGERSLFTAPSRGAVILVKSTAMRLEERGRGDYVVRSRI